MKYAPWLSKTQILCDLAFRATASTPASTESDIRDALDSIFFGFKSKLDADRVFNIIADRAPDDAGSGEWPTHGLVQDATEEMAQST